MDINILWAELLPTIQEAEKLSSRTIRFKRYMPTMGRETIALSWGLKEEWISTPIQEDQDAMIEDFKKQILERVTKHMREKDKE